MTDLHEIHTYSFQSFPEKGVRQAFYMRHGGVSPEPWASLNHGGSLGDERNNVIENRRRIFEVFGRPVESIFDVWQVHSADVVCTDAPRPLDKPHQKADAILTNNPEITLMMRFADCVPIMFFDLVRKVVGVAHAGWQGTIKKIGAEVVKIMEASYGSNAGDILAGIGPSIGPDHYEVGEDVWKKAKAQFPDRWDEILQRRNNKVYLDLWTANRITLEQVGIKHIEVAQICTACNTQDWYSHRGDHGITGRFGALIGLNQE